MRIFVLVLLVVSAARAEPTIAMQWKARGLEAISKIDSLKKRLDSAKAGSREARILASQIQLEWVFVVHVDPKLEAKAHSISGARETFHFIMNGGGTVFDLLFIYEKRKVIGTRLDNLPPGWQVFLSTSEPTLLLVMRDEAAPIAIDLSEPLESIVPDASK